MPCSFLGAFESCVTPAFSMVTSQWYLKREQGTRTGELAFLLRPSLPSPLGANFHPFPCLLPSSDTLSPFFFSRTDLFLHQNAGIWFSCNAVSMVFGSVLAYGLAKTGVDGGFAIEAWRVTFLLLGAITIALGVLLFVFLPDSPLNARFLSEQEKIMAVERIRSNNSGIGNKVSGKPRLLRARL